MEKWDGCLKEFLRQKLQQLKELGSVGEQPAGPADPNVCPLCFTQIDGATVFHQYCPLCGEICHLKGDASDDAFHRHCRRARTFQDQPMLAHAGCKRLNPLFLQDGLAKLEQESRLRWFDAEKNVLRVVDHWSLPKVRQAAVKLAEINAKTGLPEERAMWFPAELLTSIRCGKARRIFVKGSKSVGKSVLSSVAVSSLAFLSAEDIDVENYAYASPSQDRDQPFSFYASVLQSLRDLRTYQPFAIGANDPQITSMIRAGFYLKVPRTSNDRFTLVLYDLAGENLEQAPGQNVDDHFRSSDMMYAFVDITHLSVFQGCYQRLPEQNEGLEASQISRGLSTFIDGLKATGDIRKIAVITKLDLVDMEKARARTDLHEDQKKGLERLDALKAQLIATRAYPPQPIENLKEFGRTSREILTAILDPKNWVEREIATRLARAEAAFFVWTDGLPAAQDNVVTTVAAKAEERSAGQGSVQSRTPAEPYRPLEPVNPYGVAELVGYTLTHY